MRNKKSVCAVVLAGMMTLGMGMNVFAASGETVKHVADSTGETGVEKVTITKNLELADGITIPETTFEFTVTPVTEGVIPSANIQPITYGNTTPKGEKKDGKYSIPLTSEITFTGDFPHAGEYVYEVVEKQGNLEGVTYSQEKYKLRVYVANKTQGEQLYIKTITAEKNAKVNQAGEKVDHIAFTNVYTKNTSLAIEKQTVGTYADKTKAFTFHITFTKAATAPEAENTVVGQVGKNQYTFTYGTEGTFTLKHGEKLEIPSLPAGTTYTVREEGVQDGYVPSVQIVENGVQKQEVVGTDKEDLSSGQTAVLAGEKENKVTFKNTYSDENVPITGVFMNNLPFVLLIGIAVLALSGLAVMKHRRIAKK